MKVRAKFRVETKSPADTDGGGTVWLTPVTSGSEENKTFYHYTPGGNIILSTINKSAYDAFELGAEFYVDFTPAKESA